MGTHGDVGDICGDPEVGDNFGDPKDGDVDWGPMGTLGASVGTLKMETWIGDPWGPWGHGLETNGDLGDICGDPKNGDMETHRDLGDIIGDPMVGDISGDPKVGDMDWGPMGTNGDI